MPQWVGRGVEDWVETSNSIVGGNATLYKIAEFIEVGLRKM